MNLVRPGQSAMILILKYWDEVQERSLGGLRDRNSVSISNT